MKSEAGLVRVIVLSMFALLLLLATLFTSCTGCSESGKRISVTNSAVKQEKVVILEPGFSKYDDGITIITWYKVKRIDYGVVTHIKVVGGGVFTEGDTLFHKFE